MIQLSLSNSKQDDQEEEEEDRISALPEAIIVHILSFLPTRDAVTTGLLSSRWKYLWTFVPNLAFTFKNSPHFIHKTLHLLSSYSSLNNINKFSLQICVEKFDSLAKLQSAVSLWLHFATLRKMEELSLQVSKSNFVIPEFLYHHPSFTKIFTCFCDYPLPSASASASASVSWGLLKELIVESARFQDGVLQMVLLGCPLLECLELRRCLYFPNIDTTSNLKLKRLVLEEIVYKGQKFVNVEISIPNVTSLHILGTWHHTQFKLLNVSSLVDVTLDFSHFDRRVTLPQCCHWFCQLLENVKHVEKFTIGTWCIQVLSVAMAKALCPPLSNNNLTCLTLALATGLEKWDFIGVATLLRSSPCLERLVLDRAVGCDSSLKEDYKVKYHIGKDYWTSQAERVGTFCCLQSVLKSIQIVGLGQQSYRRRYLLEFIKFLLRSAMVLEKLVILTPRDTQRNMDNYYRSCQLLLSFPKSSAQLKLLLC